MSGILLGVFASQSVQKEYFIFSAGQGSPYVFAYPLNESSFGTKFADPATALPGNAGRSRFHPTGRALNISTPSVSPYINVYAWSSNGFGTKFSNPATLPTGYGYSVFSQSSMIVSSSTGGLFAYAFSTTTGFGTKFSNAPTPPSKFNGVPDLNPEYTAVSVGSESPNVAAYPWSDSTGFGTKFADPVTLPQTGNGSHRWNSAGTRVGFGYQTDAGNYATGTGGVWALSAASGWGAKFADPATPIANYYGATGVGFNNTDTVFGVSQYAFNTDKIAAWAWNNSSGFGTKYAAPASNRGDGREFSWHPAGTHISYIGNGSPAIALYPWSNSTGFGTRFADPASYNASIQSGLDIGQL